MKNYTIIKSKTLTTLLAKVLNHIEALGLREAQEQACKRACKNDFYHVVNELSWEVTKEDVDQLINTK